MHSLRKPLYIKLFRRKKTVSHAFKRAAVMNQQEEDVVCSVVPGKDNPTCLTGKRR